jgi:hypothetical protein
MNRILFKIEKKKKKWPHFLDGFYYWKESKFNQIK